MCADGSECFGWEVVICAKRYWSFFGYYNDAIFALLEFVFGYRQRNVEYGVDVFGRAGYQ